MTCPADSQPTPPVAWRIGHGDRPWSKPTDPAVAFLPDDWTLSQGPPTEQPSLVGARQSRGRFDDPNGEYIVLYGSTTRDGAFTESLGRGVRGSQELSPSWRIGRQASRATLPTPMANIGSASWLSYLTKQLETRLALYPDIAFFDGAVLRSTAHIELTQAASRVVYSCVSDDGVRTFAGIYYQSRFGNDIDCWAVFWPPDAPFNPVGFVESLEFGNDDPDLMRACERLGMGPPPPL